TDDVVETAHQAVAAVEGLLADATLAMRRRGSVDGKPSAKLIEKDQRWTHGLAWFATYAQAVRQLASYAERMQEAGRFKEIETLLVTIGIGEYLAQMLGGIPMSQGEIVRPSDFGLTGS